MKKLINLFPIVILLIAVSCQNSKIEQTKVENADSLKKAASKLEIVYFHSTNRCKTCNSVENNARKLLEENFSDQMKNGAITFASLNIDEDQNKAIAEKYQIAYSTLLLIDHSTDKEQVTDFTETAFQYAKNEPEKYISLLKDEITKLIKK
jgi:thiol-disulfide isomerase/thioredoxin